MDRVDIQDRLSLEFENDVYYQTVDKNDSIQDGYDEIGAFTGLFLKSAVIPFTQNVTYYDMRTLIPDYIGVHAIFNTVIKRWMTPTSLRKVNNDRIDWETAPGVPYHFIPVNHRYVAIYKKPIVVGYGNMFVFYVASSPTLADGTTIAIPDDYMSGLLNYTKVDLWEQAQEFGKALSNFDDYLANLEQIRVWIQNQRNPARLMGLREQV